MGSVREASARSMAATRVRSARPSRGTVIIRRASPPQVGQEIVAGAAPIGAVTSAGPSSPHRYAYRGIRGAPFVATGRREVADVTREK
ncbi:hypothetical protein GCM10023199_39670 [Actinomycetospora chibensis]